jgi:hypothetical protein
MTPGSRRVSAVPTDRKTTITHSHFGTDPVEVSQSMSVIRNFVKLILVRKSEFLRTKQQDVYEFT